jgi:hypothetical protein
VQVFSGPNKEHSARQRQIRDRGDGNPAVPAEDKTMNTSRRIASVALALTVALGLASGPALADGGKSRNWRAPDALVGAWRVTVAPRNCATGEVFEQFAFPSFLTFAKGGTMLETGSNGRFDPGQRSVGHGYWVRTAKGTYHAVIEAHVHFDSPNYKRGSQRLAQDIQMLDADSWESLADVYFYDTDGKLVDQPNNPGCARATGERMW